jgi:hypothetical protein
MFLLSFLALASYIIAESLNRLSEFSDQAVWETTMLTTISIENAMTQSAHFKGSEAIAAT